MQRQHSHVVGFTEDPAKGLEDDLNLGDYSFFDERNARIRPTLDSNVSTPQKREQMKSPAIEEQILYDMENVTNRIIDVMTSDQLGSGGNGGLSSDDAASTPPSYATHSAHAPPGFDDDGEQFYETATVNSVLSPGFNDDEQVYETARPAAGSRDVRPSDPALQQAFDEYVHHPILLCVHHCVRTHMVRRVLTGLRADSAVAATSWHTTACELVRLLFCLHLQTVCE